MTFIFMYSASWIIELFIHKIVRSSLRIGSDEVIENLKHFPSHHSIWFTTSCSIPKKCWKFVHCMCSTIVFANYISCFMPFPLPSLKLPKLLIKANEESANLSNSRAVEILLFTKGKVAFGVHKITNSWLYMNLHVVIIHKNDLLQKTFWFCNRQRWATPST